MEKKKASANALLQRTAFFFLFETSVDCFFFFSSLRCVMLLFRLPLFRCIRYACIYICIYIYIYIYMYIHK